jgi:hypothetical protein
MKKIYVIIIFLVFFNIFTFMFASFENMFPYVYEGDDANFDINGTSEEIFMGVSGNFTFDDALKLFFGDITNVPLLIASFATLGIAIAAAWLTRSPAPFVVGFLGNIMKNVYVNNIAIFEKLPINNYLMIIAGVGMILLFLVTCAETLTHGEV